MDSEIEKLYISSFNRDTYYFSNGSDGREHYEMRDKTLFLVLEHKKILDGNFYMARVKILTKEQIVELVMTSHFWETKFKEVK